MELGEAGEADDAVPELASMDSGRSTIDPSLVTFRERALDQFFLLEKGDRETVQLLMRGMPIPAVFGFPKTNGGMLSNYVAFVKHMHPLVSVITVHPLCPFSKRERLVVVICSVAFNFLWSEVFTYHTFRMEEALERAFNKDWQVRQTLFLIKNVVTILYAVVIRQIVICPCLYAPVIREACHEGEMSEDELKVRANRLAKWKRRGDRVVVLLLVFHLLLIFLTIAYIAYMNNMGGKRHLTRKNYGKVHGRVSLQMLYSEAVNVVSWFVRFTPLFCLLFPIQRAQWYQGGTLCDYLLCRRSWCVARDDRAPCVEPVTTHLREAGLLPRGLPHSAKSFMHMGRMTAFRHSITHYYTHTQ